MYKLGAKLSLRQETSVFWLNSVLTAFLLLFCKNNPIFMVYRDKKSTNMYMVLIMGLAMG